MSLPPALRGAYERGRLRDAAVSALPVLLLPTLGIGLARGAFGTVVASVVAVPLAVPVHPAKMPLPLGVSVTPSGAP